YVALAMPRGLITPIDVSNWKAGKASVNHRFPSSPAVIPTPPLVPVGSWNTVIPPVEAPTFGASAKARVRMASKQLTPRAPTCANGRIPLVTPKPLFHGRHRLSSGR